MLFDSSVVWVVFKKPTFWALYIVMVWEEAECLEGMVAETGLVFVLLITINRMLETSSNFSYCKLLICRKKLIIAVLEPHVKELFSSRSYPFDNMLK